MAVIPYSVKFGSGWGTLLNDVLSVDTQHGRSWPTDPYSPASCQIVSRNIAAWTVAPVIGDIVWVTAPTSSRPVCVFAGFIKDVQIEYGTIAALDVAHITCEGPLSKAGRLQINSVAIAQATTLNQISTLISTYLGTFGMTKGTSTSIASAQTYSGNLLDLLNLLQTTEMGTVREFGVGTFTPGDSKFNPQCYFYSRNYDTTADFTFSDNPASTSELKYDPKGISFTSAAQLYYQQATIEPQGLASQTAGSSNYSITQTSLDYTTSQALSHAQYLVNQYNSTTSRPLTITATYAQQSDSTTRMAKFIDFLSDDKSGAGNLVKIVFRGNTYYGVIEGRTMYADTSETGITITVSGYDNNNYLILNNAVFGTLGTSSTYPGNKLGF